MHHKISFKSVKCLGLQTIFFPRILSKRNSEALREYWKNRMTAEAKGVWHSRLGRGEVLWTIMREDSNAWNEGHPGQKREYGFRRVERLPDAHIFRNDIILDLKIWDMAFFKSDLGPIYISEQTAYCFHQGKISTHVYLMFPSKYLHFKAFWALSFRAVQNVAPGLLPDGPCYSRNPYHPVRMAPNKRAAPPLRPMTYPPGHCHWTKAGSQMRAWRASQPSHKASVWILPVFLLWFFFSSSLWTVDERGDCAGLYRLLKAWSEERGSR